MISINLLPSRFKSTAADLKKVPVKQVVIIIFILFLCYSVFNLFQFINLRQSKREAEGRWSELTAPLAEAQRLQNQMGAGIFLEMDFYDTLADPSPETARILNAVSNYIPSSLVLTKLQIDRRGRDFKIHISGTAETEKQSKLVEIQTYINELKKTLEPLVRLKPGTLNQDELIKTEVTTSSKRVKKDEKDLTEFQAILTTQGFKEKK